MDLERIRNLVELMVTNDLTRIEIQEGETHILLRRGGQTPTITAVPAHLPSAIGVQAAPTPAAQPAPAGAAAPATGNSGAAGATADANEILIRSPMVGTFYSAADPESPAFVKVGDTVNPNSVVCLIEAMKVFNEIKAEVSGRVTRMLVKNAQAVEFDQPLFAVSPT